MDDEDTFQQIHNQHPIYPMAYHMLEHLVILQVDDTKELLLHVLMLVQVNDNDEQDQNQLILNDLQLLISISIDEIENLPS